MKDIKFDFDTFDITDLSLVDDCSEQNAAMFLVTKNDNIINPLLGVGIYGVVEGKIPELTNILTAWRKQVIADGATQASYKINADGTFSIAAKY